MARVLLHGAGVAGATAVAAARLATLLSGPLDETTAIEAKALADALAAAAAGAPPIWSPQADEVATRRADRLHEALAASALARLLRSFGIDLGAELVDELAPLWAQAVVDEPDGGIFAAPGCAIGDDVTTDHGVVVLVGTGSIIGPECRFRAPSSDGRWLVVVGRGVVIERCVEVFGGPFAWDGSHIPAGVTLIGDLAHVERRVSVGPGSRVGDEAFLGFLTRVGHGSVIGAGAEINGAHLGESVHVGDRAEVLFEARVGAGARIGRGARVMEEAVVRAGASIDAGAVLCAEWLRRW